MMFGSSTYREMEKEGDGLRRASVMIPVATLIGLFEGLERSWLYSYTIVKILGVSINDNSDILYQYINCCIPRYAN